jgi:hypothetical protein
VIAPEPDHLLVVRGARKKTSRPDLEIAVATKADLLLNAA